jgi:hypothetical protein
VINFEKQFLDAAQHCNTEKSIKFRKSLRFRKNVLGVISVGMILFVCKWMFIDGKAAADQVLELCFALAVYSNSLHIDVLYKILLMKSADSQQKDKIETGSRTSSTEIS